MEEILPFELVGELRGRERLRFGGAGAGFAAQEVPRLADQGSHPSLPGPRPPQAPSDGKMYDA